MKNGPRDFKLDLFVSTLVSTALGLHFKSFALAVASMWVLIIMVSCWHYLKVCLKILEDIEDNTRDRSRYFPPGSRK